MAPGISHPFHRAAVHFPREKFGLAVFAISRTVYIERRSLEQGNKTVARRFCRWFSRVAAVNSPPHSHSLNLSLSLSLSLSFLVCRATRTLAYSSPSARLYSRVRYNRASNVRRRVAKRASLHVSSFFFFLLFLFFFFSDDSSFSYICRMNRCPFRSLAGRRCLNELGQLRCASFFSLSFCFLFFFFSFASRTTN